MADIITEFIPIIWSAKVLEDKKKKHIFGALANRDYEGEIKQQGDQVRIPQVGYPAINDYTRNNFGTGLTLETPNVASMTLTVDQEKYFDIAIDDVDIIQSKPEYVSKLRKNAAYKLADTQDSYIAGLYTQAGLKTTSNDSSTRVLISSSNVKTEFLLMGKKFDENNVEREGRWAAISPAMQFELIDAGILEQSNNDVTWNNGFVGRAYGFDLFVTNNLTSTNSSSVNLLFGVKNESITLAEQVVKMEMADLFAAQKGFGIAIGGLHVYGARFIPDRTGVVYAYVDNS